MWLDLIRKYNAQDQTAKAINSRTFNGPILILLLRVVLGLTFTKTYNTKHRMNKNHDVSKWKSKRISETIQNVPRKKTISQQDRNSRGQC